MASIQDKLGRVRKPRVHITYEVETEGAAVLRELPFVVGVLGDFSGNASTANKPLKERKFVQIDRDNFNEIMSKIEPKLSLNVPNTLVPGDSNQLLSVQLSFNSMEDFEPAKIVDQVEPLKVLLQARNHLRDLLTKADRSDELEAILEKVLSDKASLTQLSSDLGIESANTADQKPTN